MNNKKIFFLLALTFITLHCKLEINVESAHTETLKNWQEFGRAVWAEMKRQPDAVVAGFGLGTILNAANLQKPHYERVTMVMQTAATEKSITLTSEQIIEFNKFGSIEVPTQLNDSQKIPHMAVGLGIYTLYKNQEAISKLLASDQTPSIENNLQVRAAAQATNMLAGAISAYLLLSAANSILKS